MNQANQDMRQAIIPKSDQLNSDDLIAGDITIKITGVTIKGGQEQPVSIHFEGDDGKPYKPCKSMCRCMVMAWGADSSKYIGRSMTLYRDEKVKWAGMEVGGLRISEMSDIDSAITMALTATRGNKKPYTVRPLKPASKSKPDRVERPAATIQETVNKLVAAFAAINISVESLEKLVGVSKTEFGDKEIDALRKHYSECKADIAGDV